MIHLIVIEHLNEILEVFLTGDGIIYREFYDLVSKVIGDRMYERKDV